MTKMKLFSSVLLVLVVLFAQVGTVAAAPQTQDTTITGTIQSITTETDANGVTTVVVTLADGQTFRLSVDTAVSLGLVTLDPTTGEPVVDETKVGTEVVIDPATVIPDEEEDFHPIAEILGDFFDVDPSIVEGYHEDGFGFGVIAQAMWMSQSVSENGDASSAGCILDAKRGDVGYDDCFDFGDEPVPTNWGQFKKALKENKDKHNLGVIVSGHADDDENGQGKGKEKKPKKDKNPHKP